jgi:hypothetical protein
MGERQLASWPACARSARSLLRALPLPYPCSPAAARGWEGPRPADRIAVPANCELQAFRFVRLLNCADDQHGARLSRHRLSSGAIAGCRPRARHVCGLRGRRNRRAALRDVSALHGSSRVTALAPVGLRPDTRRARGELCCSSPLTQHLSLVGTSLLLTPRRTATPPQSRRPSSGVSFALESAALAFGAR